MGGLALLSLVACSRTGSNPSNTKTPTTTSAPIKITGEPVTDFNAIFKARNAVDHSFLSVDKQGIYGVMVTEVFDFMQYFSTGWDSVTQKVAEITSDADGQRIDGVLVDEAMTVTTRDYTKDRENDFLLRFISSNTVFGALANVRNGVIELKPFCLTNPSKNRPGEIRVFAVEELNYSDQYKIIEGIDYGSNGEPLREYWRWSGKNRCFKITSSFR